MLTQTRGETRIGVLRPPDADFTPRPLPPELLSILIVSGSL